MYKAHYLFRILIWILICNAGSVSAAELSAAGIVMIPGADYIAVEGDGIDQSAGYDGNLYQNDTGRITWSFTLPAAGDYHIQVSFLTVPGKGSPVERNLYINGVLPLPECRNIQFTRMFRDVVHNGAFERDFLNNHIRPSQEEVFDWQTSYVRDVTGFIPHPLVFHLSAGAHTISLESVRESWIIGSISFIPVNSEIIPGYEAYLAAARQAGYREVNLSEPVKFQAEFPYLRSDAMNSPGADITSGATEPSDPRLLLLNVIGGSHWQIPNRWITWTVEVPYTGLYAIHTRYLQNLNFGMFTSRRLKINGNVPFAEAETMEFHFDNSWQIATLGTSTEPFLFVLEEGINTLTMEVTLGSMSNSLYALNKSIVILNDVYMDLVRIMGLDPDMNRDYALDMQVPFVLETLIEQSTVLHTIAGWIAQNTGMRGEMVQLLLKTAEQIERMGIRHRTVAVNLNMFRQNISALGTYLLTSRNQPLTLDYILLDTPGRAAPRAELPLLGRLWFEIRRFIASFFIDSQAIGAREGPGTFRPDQRIRVWIASGRDQAMIIRNMIDDSFTPLTGIPVDFELVVGDSLLTAVLAGVGPDIALGNGGDIPVNYAARNALVDLSLFSDFNEVTQRFHPAALESFIFRDGVYALPETMSFPMFFYRTDIFERYDLTPPDSWEDMYVLLTELQKENMSFGMPLHINTTLIKMYQRGVELFTADGRSTNLGTDVGFGAFRDMSDLFRLYRIPVEYDFLNRFRSGEMPAGIVDFTIFNQLVVFAPEIFGRWAFVPIPGTWRQTPQPFLDRTVLLSPTGAVMMRNTVNRDSAWEFLKWWTSADTQYRFGMEMESLLGPAAKYNTANLEAFERLPWIRQDYNRMSEQLQWARGVRIFPGNYVVDLSVRFAFFDVHDRGRNPNEILLDYLGVIDNELQRKANEFGL